MLNQIVFNCRRLTTKIIKQCSYRMMCSENCVGLGDVELKFHKTPSTEKTDSVTLPKYGGRYFITMLPGAGIGPEMCGHVRDIFKLAGVPINFDIIEDVDRDGNQLDTEEIINQTAVSIQRNGIGIKGNLKNMHMQEDNTVLTPNVVLRNKLDLFVYLIHFKSYPGIRSKISDLDLILIRQNTEGEYAMLEHESIKGVVTSLKVMTRQNIERVAEWAFEFATKNCRKKITVVHNTKHVVLTDGMFLEVTKEVAECYPDIIFEDINISRCCSRLVSAPHQFDVLLMPNLYGAIITNIICGISGGLGLYAGTNFGSNYAVFETAHRQTGAQLKDLNVANPTAMLNAAVNMLNYLDKNCHAKLIKDAIDKTLIVDKVWTQDIGGEACTSNFIDNVKKHIEEDLPNYHIF